MSDILSTYYKSNYTIKGNIYKKKTFYTPNRITKINPDQTFKNLSPYGFYLSENNFILLSKKKLLPNLTLNAHKNFDLQKASMTQSKEISSIIKYSHDKNPLKTFQESKNFKKKFLNSINATKTDYMNNKKKIKKNKIVKDLRNDLIEFNDLKDNSNKLMDNNNNHKKNDMKMNFKSKIKNSKYLCYTEDSKEKIDNSKKAEQITNELLSLTRTKDIKNYYVKKDLEKKKEYELNSNEAIPVLDPMTYIKYNLITNPKKKDLFKSFDVQLMIMGNEKYRNNLLDGVNEYKINVTKYEDLRGPTGFDKNRVEEKRLNNIIRKMNRNFIEKRGMVFTQQTFRERNKKKKKIFNFEFDEDYKKVKKLFNKGIERYERNMNKTLSKKNMLSVDKKDINIMDKLDNEANYTIKAADDIVKFSNRFLSFDEKLNKLVSKTINTTGYLFKRTKEYHKIKTKIDQFYNINEKIK